MPDEQQLIQAIHAADDWRIPAFVLVDWLRERGDDQRASVLENCVRGNYGLARGDRNGPRSSEEFKSRLSLMPREVIVAFALDCAERALRKFEQAFPDDHRPRVAIEAAREFEEYSSGNTGTALLARLRKTLFGRNRLHRNAERAANQAWVNTHPEGEYHTWSKAKSAPARAACAVCEALEAAATRRREKALQACFIAAEDAAGAADDVTDSARQQEEEWQDANLLLQSYFGVNDWLIRQHRRGN